MGGKWKTDTYRYHFVYKTTNKITGQYYIGKHSTKRLNDSYLGSSKRLLQDIRKYGSANFHREILCMCSTAQEAFLKEHELISDADLQNPKCYNEFYGGLSGVVRCTDAYRTQASEKARAWFRVHEHPMKGRQQTPEWREHHKMSAEARARLSALRIGVQNPAYGHTGKLNATSKPVLCVEQNKVYESAMQAAKQLNCNFQNISKVCKGERHTCGGYHWKFA